MQEREFGFAPGLEKMDRFVHDGARPFTRHQALVLFWLKIRRAPRGNLNPPGTFTLDPSGKPTS